MEVKLYQTEWQGISLSDVAEGMGLPLNNVASHHFYAEFYRRLKEGNYKFQPKWLERRARMTQWMKENYDDIKVKPEGTKVAISLGAGLGIVEKPLIEEGYHIELQECQSESFEYIRESIQPTEWITTDFGVLPSNRYNLVYAFGISYVFNTSEYLSFFRHCSRILRKGGRLVLWDPEYRFSPIQIMKGFVSSVLLRRSSVENSVFWGWLRSSWVHKSSAKMAKFKLVGRVSFDGDFSPVDRHGRRILGYPVGKNPSVIQGFVFEK